MVCLDRQYFTLLPPHRGFLLTQVQWIMKLHKAHGMWFHFYGGPEQKNIRELWIVQQMFHRWWMYSIDISIRSLKNGKQENKWYCVFMWNSGKGNKNCHCNHCKGITGKCHVYQWWSDWPCTLSKMNAKPFDLEELGCISADTMEPSGNVLWHTNSTFGAKIENGYWHLTGIGLWRT